MINLCNNNKRINNGVINIGAKINEKDVIERLKVNNPTIKYIDGFSGARKKATFQCMMCGEIFERQAYNTYSGSAECPKCVKNKGLNNLKERLSINNPLIEYVGGYVDPHKQATFKCKKCDHIWKSTAYEVYTGKSHCPNCSPSPYLFTEEKVKEYVKNNNPTIEYLSGYSGSTNKAEFKCKKCGHIWSTIAFAVYLGKTGCPKCAFSKGENRIANYLNEKNITYTNGHIFKDCKNIYNLPFDFFIADKNLCIEYDGEHHFFPIIRSKAMTFEQAKEYFKKIQLRDKIKDNYCK